MDFADWIMTGHVTSLGNHLTSLFHLVFEAGFPSLHMGMAHCSFSSCLSGLVLASADDQALFQLSKGCGKKRPDRLCPYLPCTTVVLSTKFRLKKDVSQLKN